MLKSFRDYFLTFIIAGVVFAIVAYFMVGFVLDSLSPDTGKDSGETTIDPSIIDSPADKSSSFNILFIVDKTSSESIIVKFLSNPNLS